MLESINDVTSYLQAFGGALAHKLQTEAQPLFQPGDEWHPRDARAFTYSFPGSG